VTADGQGYVAISGTGQVYAYGSVQYRGNPAGFTGSIVGISVTADGQGYTAISSAGQVYAYGSVQYRGNPAGFTGNIVGISVTASGQGYGALSSYGQVYAYGAVRYWGNGDPGSTALNDVRSRIVSTARAEASNASHNKENPLGSNCNFYTTALGAGAASSACANNWRTQAWCADFARWIWGQAGAITGGLSGGAISFKSYGVNRGTWHPGATLSGVQPGDVIGYNFTTSGTGDDHVGIVVGINSDGTVSTIDGNYSNGVTPRKITRGASVISGYTSPVT
jgi:CHAP domain